VVLDTSHFLLDRIETNPLGPALPGPLAALDKWIEKIDAATSVVQRRVNIPVLRHSDGLR
jgi:hypothetical protein